MRSINIEVVHGNAAATDGDVLALKYAQAPYGLDKYVSEQLRNAGLPGDVLTPRPGGFRLHPGVPGVAARHILLVGVEPLWEFGYHEIRAFARKVLSSLAGELPETRTVIVTVHGVGNGLDEEEAFESQVAGFFDAIGTFDTPERLERIIFVEQNPGRAERMEAILHTLTPGGFQRGRDPLQAADASTRERLRAVGYASASKPHVFLAMPFSASLEDVYDYGIRNAVKSVGLLCERADLSSFTGDVMMWVRERIKTSSLVIAELSGANPNVYLEVGFAWGCGIPTVLLAPHADELRFDVRGQRCLIYERIRDLEDKLSSELRELII